MVSPIMAGEANWYHASMTKVSRGEGKSAVGLASYATGQRMKNEETGTWCKRNHPGDVEAWGTLAPKDAPSYLTDPKRLSQAWNDAQAAEKRKDSRLAHHWNIALHRDWTPDQSAEVMKEIAQALVDRYRIMVTWSVHAPTDHSDGRNVHGHLVMGLRELNQDGFGKRVMSLVSMKTSKDELNWQRGMFADIINRGMARYGQDERVSHESYEARGIALEPTKHLGNKQNIAELKGMPTPTGDENRAIRARNAEAERAGASSDWRVNTAENIVTFLSEAQRRGKMDEPNDRKIAEQLERQNTIFSQLSERDRQLQKEAIEADKKRLDAEAEEAKKNKPQNAEKEERAKQNGDISDARVRWGIALANNYDIRDPYRSLANAAMEEYGMFLKQQEELKKQAFAEKDPEKKLEIEARRLIEAQEYMAITSTRIGDNADILSGRNESPLGIIARAEGEAWQSEANKGRAERHTRMSEREKKDRASVAEGFGVLADSVRKGEFSDKNSEMTDAKAARLAKLQASQNRSREAARGYSAGQGRGR